MPVEVCRLLWLDCHTVFSSFLYISTLHFLSADEASSVGPHLRGGQGPAAEHAVRRPAPAHHRGGGPRSPLAEGRSFTAYGKWGRPSIAPRPSRLGPEPDRRLGLHHPHTCAVLCTWPQFNTLHQITHHVLSTFEYVKYNPQIIVASPIAMIVDWSGCGVLISNKFRPILHPSVKKIWIN